MNVCSTYCRTVAVLCARTPGLNSILIFDEVATIFVKEKTVDEFQKS